MSLQMDDYKKNIYRYVRAHQIIAKGTNLTLYCFLNIPFSFSASTNYHG